jgi:hypothetical protein
VANVESRISDGLFDLIANVSGIARPELMNRLALLAADATAATEALHRAEVPPPVAKPNGHLAVAVASWQTGLDLIDDAVIQILDSPDDDTGTEMLRVSLDHLRVGDVAFAGFLTAVAEMDPDLVTRDFHAFAFDDPQRSPAYDAQELTVRLRSVFRLAAEHDLSVVGFTEPEAVAFREGDSVWVIPFSDTFAVRAVIANDGNEPEAEITVTFALTPADGGGDPVTREEVIAGLDPQKATTVTFDGIELRPGGLYEVVVTAAIGEDDDVTNNTWTMVFYRNEDS